MRKNFLFCLTLACTLTLAGSLVAMANTPLVMSSSKPAAHSATASASVNAAVSPSSANSSQILSLPAEPADSNILSVSSSPVSSAPHAADLPSSAPQEQTNESDYFSSAAFIGDSRTQGLMTCSDLSDATFYAAKGLNVSSIFTKETVKSGNKYITIIDALKLHKFKEVYIMLGINELGWQYSSIFIEKYGEVIDAIQKCQPNAKIIVQPIFPVTAERSATDSIFNNKKITQYNSLIKKMAEEKHVIYLDVSPALTNSSGSLSTEGSVDGIHLTHSYCQKWCNFLKNNIQ